MGHKTLVDDFLVWGAIVWSYAWKIANRRGAGSDMGSGAIHSVECTSAERLALSIGSGDSHWATEGGNSMIDLEAILNSRIMTNALAGDSHAKAGIGTKVNCECKHPLQGTDPGSTIITGCSLNETW
jgi:hypothetical protein